MSKADELKRWEPEPRDFCRNPYGLMCNFYSAKKNHNRIRTKSRRIRERTLFQK